MLSQSIRTGTGLMMDALARWIRRCIYSYRWRYIGYGLNSILGLLNWNKKFEDKLITIQDYDLDLNISINPREHIGSRIFFNGYYEGREVFVLKKMIKQDDVIVDIGANIGSWTLLFAKMANKGSVYAFEPSARYADLLKNVRLNPSLNNVDCHHLALGDLNAPVKKDLAYGQVQNEGMIRFFPDDSTDDPHSVKMTTLDEWTEDHKIERMNWMKIDTEGMEFQILKGGKKTLTAFRPNLLIEVNRINLKVYNSTISGLYDLIFSYGYRYFYTAGRRGKLEKSDFTAHSNMDESQNIFCSVNPMTL